MKRAYLDTSVWIARAEGGLAYRNLVRKELHVLKDDGWQFCLSDLVILEVLLKPYRENRQNLISGYNRVFSEAVHFSTFDTVFHETLTFAQRDNLKVLDAIHVAFAVNLNP